MGESVTSSIGTAPVTTTQPAVQAASGGGDTAAAQGAASSLAPTTDLATAFANLYAQVEQLASIVAALQGAMGVQGGGAPDASVQTGCGCGSTTAMPAALPSTPDGAAAAPDVSQSPEQSGSAAPEASKSDSPAPTQASGSSEAGDVRKKIVATARAELARGVKEDAGKDRDKAGRIREYRTAVTGKGEDPDAAEAWCADFASWVWKQAGTPFGPKGKGSDSTEEMVAYAKKQGTWKPRGKYTPKPGDLVFFNWRSGRNVDHVAIVTKVENGKVHTIGGNERASVKASSYPLSYSNLKGYIPASGG